ncbi:UNVERIFIED_CONTAM: Wall-associated receptor kinase-like 2 [Sesamum latifolium]|uniref:Wall-associated receptor kinase-like 2 n=1 Tax=Sesamum latifolium TaxID=2727402 RepID=A0AAW2SNT6_9LAMI
MVQLMHCNYTFKKQIFSLFLPDKANMQISSLLHFALLLLFPLHLSWTVADNSTTLYFNTSFADGPNIAKPGCLSKCGDLTVPYPFGIGIKANCSVNPFFDINCNSSFNHPKAFLGEHEVLGISETKILIRNKLAYLCYIDNNTAKGNDFDMDFSGTPFSFSNQNKLTLVGCNHISLMSKGSELETYTSSCVAVCSKPQELSNGSCSGIGCCQASIPKGLQYIDISVLVLNVLTGEYNFNPCGYSFLAEQNSYIFSISDISDSSFINRTEETLPLVIDWAIANQTCNDSSEIICERGSVCVDSDTTLGGYRCNCSRGYQGNPYLKPGCQDINECVFNPCHPKAICINLPGSFNCSCPPNYLGDGTKYGSGCIYLPPPNKTALYTGLPIGAGLFILLAVSFWLYKYLRKRRVKQLKQSIFKRNGGLLLQQHMSADLVLGKMKIFTSKELEKATDRFNESRILGRGGQGTVYKGMLSDGRIVAVKKSKQVDANQLEEFINEVVILSQINHRNVVTLLGCCLETEVPLLVYEFVPNGTLYDLIHDDSTGFPFSWDLRLRIAADIANALAYLHYAISIPIYHRDMKSNNILLDEKYRAKLSDFGISRSVAIDQTHLTTKVQGTFGYLDPQYFQTSQFTEKSDVYSFGVVLVELLTGQKPISTSVTEEEKSLATRFLTTMEENRLQTILDSQITEQGDKEEHLAVANLARRCLNLTGRKRPTIREVAMELESIRPRENPSFIESNTQDISFTGTDSFQFPDDGPSWTQNVGFES